MRRRSFLRCLGLTSAALAIDPSLLAASSPAAKFSRDYPQMHFTGFKAGTIYDDDPRLCRAVLAGQFLWIVDWEDVNRKIGQTFYYVNCTLECDAIRTSADPKPYILAQIQNSLLTVKRFVEQAITEASEGYVMAFPLPDEASGSLAARKIRWMKLSPFRRQPERRGGWDPGQLADEALALIGGANA